MLPVEKTEEIHEWFTRSKGISTDTRSIVPGQLFFALKGERFNGNEKAGEALEKGALAAVVDENVTTSGTLIQVENVLQTLQNLAQFHRRQFEIPVLAIGGSNGKTTTKELVRHVLEKKYRVNFTQGNLNNHIGVPLTLLQMDERTEIAVVEIGTNHPGEIAMLCEMVQPTHGIITNIGKEHLEGFGSIEGVAKEESELFHFLLKNKGTAFVNMADPWLMQMSGRLSRKVYYGINGNSAPNEAFLIEPVSTFPELKFCLPDSGLEGSAALFGSFNLENIAAAAAIGHHFGVQDADILSGIASYRPANMRSQFIKRGGQTIIADCYNANPDSMAKALDDFSKLKGRKLAILGDMLEMGVHAPAEHKAMLEKARNLDLEGLITIGPEFLEASKNSGLFAFSDTTSATSWFKENAGHYDYILLKASRGIGLEKLLEGMDKKFHH